MFEADFVNFVCYDLAYIFSRRALYPFFCSDVQPGKYFILAWEMQTFFGDHLVTSMFCSASFGKIGFCTHLNLNCQSRKCVKFPRFRSRVQSLIPSLTVSSSLCELLTHGIFYTPLFDLRKWISLPSSWQPFCWPWRSQKSLPVTGTNHSLSRE